jgi:dTDP-4-amino-4,6-dideoxy-D-galactose acyltransferase
MNIKSQALCRYLEWDSALFGVEIANVLKNVLDANEFDAITQWCEARSIDCVCLLADPSDRQTVALAEDYGFRLIDIRVTLEYQFGDIPAMEEDEARYIIRPSAPQDIPALRSIAKCNHRDSRFYYDANFPTDRCDALYETWIENSCNGYAAAVFVAETKLGYAGYITCHLVDQNTGQIGLFGVASGFRGQGIGRGLIDESLRWFADYRVKQVRVVTQGRNLSAQRLYGRAGFLPSAMQLWYHRWFSNSGGQTSL